MRERENFIYRNVVCDKISVSFSPLRVVTSFTDGPQVVVFVVAAVAVAVVVVEDILLKACLPQILPILALLWLI